MTESTSSKMTTIQSVERRGRKPSTGAPRCTVGLLTWKPGEETYGCISSLMLQTESSFELLWMDNGSPGEVVNELQSSFPEIPTCQRLPANIGFCSGHNKLIQQCRTKYYLALNQDVVLAPDYIETLCNWLDECDELALVSGLVLQIPGLEEHHAGGEVLPASVYSAGICFPRQRFPFEIGMEKPIRDHYRKRRITPGVDGCAMMMRMDACERISLTPGSVLPDEFFAYMEEVDLAIRLHEAGYQCGVEGTTAAIHEPHSSGGLFSPAIGGRFIANHWLVSLRHERWRDLLRELPYIIKGECKHWSKVYFRQPRSLLMSFRYLLVGWLTARRSFHELNSRFPGAWQRMQDFKQASRKALLEDRALQSSQE